MSALVQIQAAVQQLNDTERYEFAKWLLHQIPSEALDEELTDGIALERFQALDTEEELYANRRTR